MAGEIAVDAEVEQVLTEAVEQVLTEAVAATAAAAGEGEGASRGWARPAGEAAALTWPARRAWCGDGASP